MLSAPVRSTGYRWGVWVVALGLGCSGPANDKLDDSAVDAPDDSAVDDSAADDSAADDSAADDSGDTGACAGVSLDLTDPRDVLVLSVSMTTLRDTQETLRFGVVDAEGSCPLSESLPSDADGRPGQLWTGGCTTASGVVFEGSLTTRTGAGYRGWEGAGWRVSGGAVTVEFNGTWTVEDSSEGGLRQRDEAVSGALLRLRGGEGDVVDEALPMGFTGNWNLSRFTTEAGLDDHSVTAALSLPCVGDVEVDFQTLHTPEAACPNGLPDGGGAELRYDGQTATLRIEGTRACEGCWAHAVDGERLGEACF